MTAAVRGARGHLSEVLNQTLEMEEEDTAAGTPSRLWQGRAGTF
jgi:hypothetical protein